MQLKGARMGSMSDLLTNDLFPQAPAPVMLRGPADLEGFRRAARSLLAQNILPAQVSWHSSNSPAHELAALPPDPPPTGDAPAVQVPPEFVALCESAILHSNPGRFALLYRLLWRLVREPGLRHDPLDADMAEARRLAHEVQRDVHKMKAFVRFRSVQDDTFRNHPEGGPLHVAWFEPEHHIVEAVAPFFARRFAQMRWAVLTPEASAQWDGARLQFGPGASKEDAPEPDAGEKLWLRYHQHIFHPARLKMMQKDMRRKDWRNLPEAVLAQPLVSAAHQRSSRVGSQPATRLARRPPPARAALAVPASSAHGAGEQTQLSFEGLREATDQCRECPIGEHATQAVCGEGSRRARLMFVGEQPGDREDLQGKPFVGPAGQLLDNALEQLGIPRKDVFVTNAVKHFKYELRGKRRIHKTPTQREAAACLHWLEDEITLVQPEVLVALGATAARSLMGHAVPVLASRGQLLERADGRKVLVTLHPSALLRMRSEDREAAWQAWLDDLSALQKSRA
jgi:probable DNA metabolism protein